MVNKVNNIYSVWNRLKHIQQKKPILNESAINNISKYVNKMMKGGGIVDDLKALDNDTERKCAKITDFLLQLIQQIKEQKHTYGMNEQELDQLINLLSGKPSETQTDMPNTLPETVADTIMPDTLPETIMPESLPATVAETVMPETLPETIAEPTEDENKLILDAEAKLRKEQERQAAEAKLKEKQDAANKLKNNLNATESEIQLNQTEIERIKAEIDGLNNKLTELNKNLEAKNNIFNNLKTDLDATETEIGTLNGELLKLTETEKQIEPQTESKPESLKGGANLNNLFVSNKKHSSYDLDTEKLISRAHKMSGGRRNKSPVTKARIINLDAKHLPTESEFHF